MNNRDALDFLKSKTSPREASNDYHFASNDYQFKQFG